GVRNYMNGLYAGLSKNDAGIEVSFLESPESFLGMGAGTAFFFDNLFKSFANYDIIHNPGTSLLMPLKKNGCTLITTIHDLIPLLYPELQPEVKQYNIKDRLWYELLVKRADSLALESDILIALSIQTRDEILKFGYDEKKITIVS